MKISFLKAVAAIAVGVVVTFSACKNSPYPGYDSTENGLYYQFYKQVEGAAKPKEGDRVRIVMSYKDNTDSVIFDSKVHNRSGSDYTEFTLDKPPFKGSFEEAVAMMGVGDSASFIINADSLYLKRFNEPVPQGIEKGSMLTFTAKLIKITTKAEVDAERNKKIEEQKAMLEMFRNKEPEIFTNYLEKNKITAKPTASGLYYIETKKGSGKKPKPGDVVKVNYTGKLMDGTVFDTSDETIAKASRIYNEQTPYGPVEFSLEQEGVIPGWIEGLMLMNVGSKGQLIIPSALAYGPQGRGPIPPYSPLVFDLELVSISAAPATSAPMVK